MRLGGFLITLSHRWFSMTQFLNRESTYPILPLLLSRVSYRAFSEERLSEEELMSLFEAARWAPSSYNNQPWRYVYVRRGDPKWDTFFNVLIEWNKKWCSKADTLVLVISRNNFEHNNKPSVTACFDTGASWMSLAIEAHSRNLIAHGMQGFDYTAIRNALQIPESFTVEAMIAIGKPGNGSELPTEIREKEVPSTRKPLEQIVSHEVFSFS
jgi:nitroreductase